MAYNRNNGDKEVEVGAGEKAQQLRADILKIIKFQRSPVQFSALTSQLTAVCNSTSRESDIMQEKH